MIVESMTQQELTTEVLSDFINVMQMFNIKSRIRQSEMQRTHKLAWVETIHVKSQRNNEWSITVNISPTARDLVCYVKAYDKTGLLAYSVNMFQDDIPLLVKYSSHFLKRYTVDYPLNGLM